MKKHNQDYIDLNEISKIFRTLANPVRLQIIQYLLNHSTCTNNELVDILYKSQPTVSQHIKKLLNANIIFMESKGPSSIYSINFDYYNQLIIKFEFFSKYMRQHMN